MALNIVHAVEFSRNGRTRVTASRPALRATYLSYHPRCGLRNTKFRPAAESAWRRRRERRSSSGAVYHLRLEITESQCDFEAIWLRISPVSAGPLSASRTAVATCKNLRGAARSRQIRAASRACRACRPAAGDDHGASGDSRRPRAAAESVEPRGIRRHGCRGER